MAKNGEQNKVEEKRGEEKLSPIVSHTVFRDASQLTQYVWKRLEKGPRTSRWLGANFQAPVSGDDRKAGGR